VTADLTSNRNDLPCNHNPRNCTNILAWPLKMRPIGCLETSVRNLKDRRSHLSYLTSEGCSHLIFYSHMTVYRLLQEQRMALPYCHLHVWAVVDCLFVSRFKLQVVVVRVGSSLKHRKVSSRSYILATFSLTEYRIGKNVRVVVQYMGTTKM
jgi:hypothetical protein